MTKEIMEGSEPTTTLACVNGQGTQGLGILETYVCQDQKNSDKLKT